jgi:hypothetical protein
MPPFLEVSDRSPSSIAILLAQKQRADGIVTHQRLFAVFRCASQRKLSLLARNHPLAPEIERAADQGEAREDQRER